MTQNETAATSASVVAIVGGGSGIGASVAERFAREGYSVALVARNGERLSAMATDLAASTGARFATASADVTAPEEVRGALDAVADRLGAVTALCFSPLPDTALIKPVLETRPKDFMDSLRLNVAGAAAAVANVLTEMLDRGHGSLLFTTGSAALTPSPARAASAVTTTAATTYVALLREALAETGVRVGHTVIVGPVARDRADAHHPDDVATDVWAHYQGLAEDFPTVLRLP